MRLTSSSVANGGLLACLCSACAPRFGLIVDIPDAHLGIRAASGKLQRFIQLRAIVREFIGPAHLSSAGAFLIRHQPIAVPMRRNLLGIAVLRLLQLPPVGKKRALALLVIEHIDLDVLLGLRKRERACGIQHFLHPLAVLVAFVSASAPPSPVRTSSHSRDAHPHSSASASASSAVRATCLLHFLPRVIAFIAIELPSSEDRGPRLHWRAPFRRPRLGRRRRLWLCCRQRPRRCLRSRACWPAHPNKSQAAGCNA